jgi:glycosyltransferase involved in cell wall biosynthesis
MTSVDVGRPQVSILMPTYNRAAFLPAAFESVAAQTFADWELIVVDDGSTDDTEEAVSRLAKRFTQPVRYVKQANAGAYAARNAALGLAVAPYVAFYDSDDVWLSHHLSRSVAALEDCPDVDWVYAACRMVHYRTGAILSADTFQLNGHPRRFRRLETDRRGPLFVFDDARTVACAVVDGLYCGLQNSVIRRSVFEATAFQTAFRNEAEDQLFLIRTLKRGHRVGYIDDVHVQYHVHDANSSASAIGQTLEAQLAIYRPLVRGFEALQRESGWSTRERRALAQRLCREYFWHIGYAVLWKGGRRRDALESFRAGLRQWPWNVACWKTYLLARLRLAVSRSSRS